MALHHSCATSLTEQCQRHSVPMLLRDCPAAAPPASQALSITQPWFKRRKSITAPNFILGFYWHQDLERVK